jgi:hypothetical protein
MMVPSAHNPKISQIRVRNEVRSRSAPQPKFTKQTSEWWTNLKYAGIDHAASRKENKPGNRTGSSGDGTILAIEHPVIDTPSNVYQRKDEPSRQVNQRDDERNIEEIVPTIMWVRREVKISYYSPKATKRQTCGNPRAHENNSVV